MKDFYSYQIEDTIVYQTPQLWATYQSYNYIISKGSRAWVFDPGELAPIQKTIETNHLQVEAIYLTHHHGDHVGAAEQMAAKYKCETIGFTEDQKRLPRLTKTYFDGEILEIAGHKAQVIHLPGHTLGLCAFYFSDLNAIFSNDHVFSLGCGRVFEGSMQQMYESLKKFRDLPDNTLIFSSHEYTHKNLQFGLKLFPQDEHLQRVAPHIHAKVANNIPTVPVDLAFEKKHNPLLRWDDLSIRKAMELESAENWEVFAEIRRLRDFA